METAPKLANRLNLLLLALLLTFAAGCDLLGGEDEETVTSGVYVANQGPWGGSGSITVYDPATEAVSNPPTMQGRGSIIQSIEIQGDRLYVVANTGNRVDVFDLNNNALVDDIPVWLPRYVAFHSPTKAYVTSQTLYYGAPSSVKIVNPQTLTVLDSVVVGGNAEQIAIVGDRAYVATGTFGATQSVAVIDTQTDQAELIDVDCDAPRYVLADDDGEVFVICTGVTLYDDDFQPVGKTNGAIRVLGGETGEIIGRIDVDAQLGTGGVGQDAYYEPEVDELYVVKEGNRILRIDTETNTLDAQEIGPLEGGDIGAVAYDAVSNRLYVGHIPNYASPGTVTIHDRSGALLDQFTAGVAPAYITFRRAVR